MAPNSLIKSSEGLDMVLETIGLIEKLNLNLEINQEEEGRKIEDTEVGKGDVEKKSKEEDEKGQENSEPSEIDEASEEETRDKKDKQLKSLWNTIDKNIEDIHFSWNEYGVDLLHKASMNEKGEDFQQSINKLTKAVEDRGIVEMYDFGSQSIFNLKPFFDLYLDEIRGDISEIKYMTYQSYLKALSGNLDEGEDILQGWEDNISKIKLRNQDDEEKVKEVDKLNLALAGMEKSLQVNSKRLFIIKKDIIIERLKKLE